MDVRMLRYFENFTVYISFKSCQNMASSPRIIVVTSLNYYFFNLDIFRRNRDEKKEA